MHHLSKIPAFVATATVVLLILYATLMPDPLPGSHIQLFKGADKIIHGIMFFALSLAFSFDYTKLYNTHSHPYTTLICIAVISTLCGCLIEIAQGMMHLGRTADILDAVADTMGAFAGAFLWIPLQHRIFK